MSITQHHALSSGRCVFVTIGQKEYDSRHATVAFVVPWSMSQQWFHGCSSGAHDHHRLKCTQHPSDARWTEAAVMHLLPPLRPDQWTGNTFMYLYPYPSSTQAAHDVHEMADWLRLLKPAITWERCHSPLLLLANGF